jgi:PAS domain S-box-containing protein
MINEINNHMKSKSLSLRSKLLLGYSSALILLISIFSLILYPIMRRTIEANVESELKNTTKTILSMVKTSVDASIKNYLRAIAEKNRDIVSYYYQQSKKGLLTEKEAKEEAGKALLIQTIGRTGYIFVWDINKAPKSILLAVHPKIQGEDVAYVDFVQKGAQIKNGYIEYEWKNPGEEKAREKAMYLAYFKPWSWVIAASSYREEFGNLINIDHFRDSILSIRFGRSGYSYIIDSKGNVIVHPVLSGNLYDAKDSEGRQFVREIRKEKNGKIIYTWRNPDEKEFRRKLVIFNYIPEFDWIVASTSYLDEIYEPLNHIRNTIIALFIVSLVFLFILTFGYSSYILNNLNRLIQGFRTGSAGDLTVRINKTSKDEFGSLSEYFNDFMEKLYASNQSLLLEIRERRRSEANYRSVIENIQDVFYRVDINGNLIMASPSFLTLLGYGSLEECLGRPFAESYYYEVEQSKKFIREIRETGSVMDHEAVLKRKDGTPVTVETNSHFYIDEAGKIAGIEGIFRDITERKRNEDVLRKSEEQYQTLVENANEAILVVQDGIVKFLNGRALESFGYTAKELSSTPIFELIHPEDRDAVIERYRQKIHGDMTPTLNTHRIIHKSGKLQWIEISSVRIEWEGRPATLNFITNITKRVRAEEENRSLQERLQRSEKMESLGLLAGGVAHDLNNVLGIVVGYADLLLLNESQSISNRAHLEEIMKGGQKAAAIVQDLLTLARRGVSGKSVINLNKIIDDNQKSPEFRQLSYFHPSIRIKTELEPELMNITGSSVHLSKTILNLASNACEAMPNGGVLTIRTSNQYLDKPIQGYDEIRDGDYVVLSVSDTGMGIQEADLKRIFEPFYTKKVMGRSGTGLGLAVVWGTVKDHNGYINVRSEEGKGSVFTLYFPVTREELSPETSSVKISEYTGKGESILIVDDVKGQRNLAEEMLRKLNYRVTSVSSGEEAVAYLKDHRVDLLILDMIMDPGMDGLDTFRSALKIRPEQRAIIVSGFSETDRVKEALELGAGAYVKKPYVIENLGLAVKKELDRPA